MVLSQAEPAPSDYESEQITIAPDNAADFGLHGLADQEVRSSDDQPIGKIVDFVIDADSGRATYTIVSVGGFFGIGRTLYIIPTMALRPSKGGTDLTVSIPKGKWEDVPKVTQDDFAGDHLGLTLEDRRQLGALFSRSLATGDAQSHDFPAVSRPIRATEIRSKVVVSGGKQVGKIEDVVCDFDHGCVARALLWSNPEFTGSDRLFLVPIAKLRIESAEEDPIVAMLLAEDFQHAAAAKTTR